MTFFTADTHFGHANIIRYCNRPFSSIQEHDEHLIDVWNKKVPPNAEIFVVGDFCFRAARGYEEKVFRRLNGNIQFIAGNHDNVRELKRLARVNDLLQIKRQDQKIILCHYAMRVWNASHHGSIHLYGHSHSELEHTPYGKSMDVGVDNAKKILGEYEPFHLDEILQILKDRKASTHHDA